MGMGRYSRHEEHHLDLGTFIALPVLILLDHSQWNRFHLLISCKTLSAGITETAAADRIGILYRSGIYNSCIILVTERTSHGTLPLSGSKNHY